MDDDTYVCFHFPDREVCHACGGVSAMRADAYCECGVRRPSLCKPCFAPFMENRSLPSPALFHPDYLKNGPPPIPWRENKGIAP